MVDIIPSKKPMIFMPEAILFYQHQETSCFCMVVFIALIGE
jgi:hypothetical protein